MGRPAMVVKETYFESPIGHPRDRIIVHESQDIPREGLFVSLNSFPFLIKPGHPIDLPRPVRLMLDTRIRTETIQGQDGGKDFTRDIPRVTYTIVQLDVPTVEAEEAKAGKELDPFKGMKSDPFKA